ncbi:O-antigen ligase family protein [Trujillonella humicola]|uniref:O-antigen ligase family protein n=1 Tax=Trujillonella humicola TaxID=3383699 RepID=UPI003905D598
MLASACLGAAAAISRPSANDAAIGLVAVLLLLMAAAVTTGRGLVVLAVVSLFSLPPVLNIVAAAGSESAPLKLLLILFAVAAGLKVGWRSSGLELVWLGMWTLALVFSVLGPDPFGLGPVGMTNAYLGYISGWLWLFVRVPPDQRQLRLRLVESSAALCVLAGLILSLAGLIQFAHTDASGVPRLAGSLIPPQVAMLAVCGLIATIVRGHRGHSRGHWTWITLNTAIACATVTRGAILAVVIIVLAHVATTVRTRRLARGRLAAVGLLSTAFAVTASAIALRSQGNSYEGPYNTSGRTEAWEFYRSIAEREPWWGSGLGASSVANSIERPLGVQSAFQSPHNEYIHFWLDAGLPIALALFVIIAAIIYRNLRRSCPAGMCLAVAVSILTFAFVDNPFSTVQFTGPLALVLAAAAAERPRAAQESPVA